MDPLKNLNSISALPDTSTKARDPPSNSQPPMQNPVNEQFKELEKTYRNAINSLLLTEEWQAIYDNKYLAHIFFNKIDNKKNISKEDKQKLKAFENSTSSTAQTELLRSLKSCQSSPLLTERSKEIIDNLIELLEKSLSLAFIIDGIRAKSPELVALTMGQKVSGAKLGSLHKQINAAELSIIVNKIISDIHNLKQGEYFH